MAMFRFKVYVSGPRVVSVPSLSDCRRPVENTGGLRFGRREYGG